MTREATERELRIMLASEDGYQCPRCQSGFEPPEHMYSEDSIGYAYDCENEDCDFHFIEWNAIVPYEVASRSNDASVDITEAGNTYLCKECARLDHPCQECGEATGHYEEVK